MRGVCGRAIDRAPHNGHAATAAAHVRAHLVAYVRIQPPSVQNAFGSRANEPLRDTRIMRREHGHPRPPSREIAALPRRCKRPHHGSGQTNDWKHAEALATLLLHTKLLHPLSAAKAANPVVEPG